MNEPFPKEAELAEKTARPKTLNMDQKDKEILDGFYNQALPLYEKLTEPFANFPITVLYSVSRLWER